MIPKAYAEHLLRGVYGEDLRLVGALGYPPISSYCREYLSGYRASPDVLWRSDIDKARNTLHAMRSRHGTSVELIKRKFRDGKGVERNALNCAIRTFRREFQAATGEQYESVLGG